VGESLKDDQTKEGKGGGKEGSGGRSSTQKSDRVVKTTAFQHNYTALLKKKNPESVSRGHEGTRGVDCRWIRGFLGTTSD